ncbi:MAG: AbrB/MazE/SpoVT family DNA-binding domain-containing protein [Desulfurococcales archaeon]|nr:AbrB/MazE/SpoVT family DNA-binding domain-containing protein [Desulfurococcales archaeon]
MELGLVKLGTKSSSTGHISHEITIPKEFIEKLGWKPGTKLLLKLADNKIIIGKTRITEVPP